MIDPGPLIAERIEQSIAVKRALTSLARPIAAAGEALLNAYRHGHKALFFGNGGSAADAQHLAAELAGKYVSDRPPLRALALTVNSSAVTAISNDYGFAAVFSRQLEAWGDAGDVAVAISTSGRSANVVQAVATAKERGLVTIALVGQNGGELQALVDHCIAVPSVDTPRIQEAHILVGHIWCEMVESGMFPAAER